MDKQFIAKYAKELATKNYNQLEILFGNQISNNIFDSCIDSSIYKTIKEYFKKKYPEFSTQYIENKVYYDKNMELQINNSFQQRVFKHKLFDELFVENNEKIKYKIAFSEKKMISIENFPTKYEYGNEFFQKMTSINIKNKFYLNFTEITNLQNKTFYKISILMKRKTNNKFSDLYLLMKEYIEQITSIFNI